MQKGRHTKGGNIFEYQTFICLQFNLDTCKGHMSLFFSKKIITRLPLNHKKNYILNFIV